MKDVRVSSARARCAASLGAIAVLLGPAVLVHAAKRAKSAEIARALARIHARISGAPSLAFLRQRVGPRGHALHLQTIAQSTVAGLVAADLRDSHCAQRLAAAHGIQRQLRFRGTIAGP